MEAHHLGLGAHEHCQVLGTHLACGASRLGDRTQTLGVVVRLQALAHGLACFARDVRLPPERIVDVQAASALLPKTCDASLGIFSGEAPHSEAAETACVAHGGRKCGSAEPAHRCLKDRPFEIKPLAKGISGPHVLFLEREIPKPSAFHGAYSGRFGVNTSKFSTGPSPSTSPQWVTPPGITTRPPGPTSCFSSPM
jgi:hypothetical protein